MNDTRSARIEPGDMVCTDAAGLYVWRNIAVGEPLVGFMSSLDTAIVLAVCKAELFGRMETHALVLTSNGLFGWNLADYFINLKRRRR